MNAPLITIMRDNPIFIKLSSVITVFFFLFTFYSPSVLAAKEAIEKEQKKPVVSIQGNTDEAKLANTLQAFKDKTALQNNVIRKRMDEESGVVQTVLNFLGLSTLSTENLDELEALNTNIQALHEKTFANFQQLETQLTSKKLPEEILNRHYQTVEKYKAEYQAFQDYLKQCQTAESLQDQQAAMDKLNTFLQGQQFKRSQQPFDPNNLPFGSPNADDTRKPITDKKKITQLIYGSKDNDPQIASHLISSFISSAQAQNNTGINLLSNNPNDPQVEDLSESVDVQITQAIRGLAQQLNNSSVEIYYWVRNNIEFLPTYGSIQGSDMTLQTKKGNPFDTASLLIALLRAANIPARYGYGTVEIPIEKAMNWVGGVTKPEAALQILGQGGIPNQGISQGGKITHVQLEQIWVEAWVDFSPSRGAKRIKGDSWIPLDASFKQYDYTSGMDIQNQVPFDAQVFSNTIINNAMIDETTGTVQNIDQSFVQTQLEQYQQQVEQFISNQNPNSTIVDLLGSKVIRPFNSSTLASGLPYQQIARTNFFSVIPESLRHKYRFRLQDQFNSEVFTQIIDLPSIAGKTLALSFKPATEQDKQTISSFIPVGITEVEDLPSSLPGYLVNLKPELVVNG